MSQANAQTGSEADWNALWSAGINTDPSLERIVKKGSPDWNFDDRIREAYILLENRLREVAGLPSHEYGAGLVDAAFSPNKGVLQPVSPVGAENAGLHELFHGAFLYYRNPSAHRTVNHDKQSAWLIFHLINHLLLTLEAVAETVVPITGFVSPHEGRIRRRKDFRLDVDQDGDDELLICLDVAEIVTSDGYQSHLLPVILDKQGTEYRRIPCESLPGESMYGAYRPS
ncbi:MAG: TIGR02391 family protein, partial [Thermomicrobia bacterium]|nr:TIGR02391 family protein [Thermomicrobia bacterium]